MSNYSRRPISSRPSGGILPCDTQRELKDRLAEDGYTLKSTKRNVGDWNESRDFYAVRGDRELYLDNASKGDRPDWQYMWDEFQRTQPMF